MGPDECPMEGSHPGWLKSSGKSRILKEQTSLSAGFPWVDRVGGEMSGLTAHFLFGANSPENPRRSERVSGPGRAGFAVARPA